MTTVAWIDEAGEATAGTHPRTLRDVATGGRARITALASRFPERVDALAALGVAPGTELTVRQRYPVIIIAVGETTLALDLEVAADIQIETAD